MNDIINAKVQELVEVIRKYSDQQCVSFNLFVSSENYTIVTKHRTPADLVTNHISMRNLQQEWIKE